MSSRVDYCKRLLKKALIIEQNLGSNEREDVSNYVDELGLKYDNNDFLVDDVNPCKCKRRSDVILMNERNYCCDCMCIIKEKKDGPKAKEEESKA